MKKSNIHFKDYSMIQSVLGIPLRSENQNESEN